MVADGGKVSACSFCGTPLRFAERPVGGRCMVCGERAKGRAVCPQGHFVCDPCRGSETMALIDALAACPSTADPVALFLRTRQSAGLPMHGPEHHALVPAAFLVAYHRLHGEPSWQTVIDTVDAAGRQLPGGACGLWGACAAALGMGMAYCAILGSEPTAGPERAVANGFVARVLERIAAYPGVRCCRRECLLALQAGCDLSGELLPHPVATAGAPTCDQIAENDDCFGAQCPYWE